MASVLKVLDRWFVGCAMRSQLSVAQCGFRATVSNADTFWDAMFLQKRCRTTDIDVLRGGKFATAAGGLVRVLFEGGCVSVVILYIVAFSLVTPAAGRVSRCLGGRWNEAEWLMIGQYPDRSLRHRASWR